MKIGTVALESYDVEVSLENGVPDEWGRVSGMLCLSNARGWVALPDYSPAPSILKRRDARAMLNDAATYCDPENDPDGAYASRAAVLEAITGYTMAMLASVTEQPGIYP